MKKYILEGKEVVAIEDVRKWGKWFERAKRIVKQQTLKNGLWVSTVFLGIDHRFDQGEPLLFETMVFKSTSNLYEIDVDRYSTWDEAEQGHKEMVKKYKNWGE